jgi:NitT/TauT family transport system substrate-binding protein
MRSMLRHSCVVIAVFGALCFRFSLELHARPAVLRVGHFATITHAQGLIGHTLTRQGKGWFEERLGPGVKIEWSVYNAGPSAMEAIFSGAVDLTYVGPNPAVNAHLRSRGEEIRIIAGACSGGAALVVHADGPIQEARDFKGRKVATPQFGNTQDVAARFWLRSQGLRVTLTGGDVLVMPAPGADQLVLFQRKQVDAVWTVEPWVSRLLFEANGKMLLEESSLWPETDGRYVTTHLASSTAILKRRPDLVKRFLAAHVELTEWIHANPDDAKRLVNEAMRQLTTRPLPEHVLEAAWKRLELTHDPIPVSLLKSAEHAHEIGFLRKKPELSRLYDLRLLNEVLRERQLPEVR